MLDSKNWKGKSAGTPLASFDREELKLGIKDEMEHTDDQQIAARIAADHLMSNPHYYSNLKRLGIDESYIKNEIVNVILESMDYDITRMQNIIKKRIREIMAELVTPYNQLIQLKGKSYGTDNEKQIENSIDNLKKAVGYIQNSLK